jgi:AraC-like DNA-binding protein
MSPPGASYLMVDELSPRVHLAVHSQSARDNDYRYRVLSHHLMLLESGWLETKVGRRTVRAVAGDLVSFRSSADAWYRAPNQTRAFQAQLEFASPPRHTLTPWLEGIGPLPVIVSLGQAFDDVRMLFETWCTSLGNPAPAHQLRVRAAVYELLAIVSTVADPASNAPAEKLDRWQRARLRLETALDADVPVRELARQHGVSADRFIRDFRVRFGMTPKACRTRARLQEAERLIRSSDRPIKSIAYAVGFRDPKFFARQFRKHMLVRPTDLRERQPAEKIPSVTPKRLYPFNRFVLPPGVEDRWIERLRVSRR